MRKYEGVNIIAALGAVMENNTKHHRSDYRIDRKMFLEAATAPDGENNHLLWLSRKSGTECFQERNVYLKGTYAHNTWCYYADSADPIRAYAVQITGFEAAKVMGNLYELDYPRHVEQVKRDALSTAIVDVHFESGADKRYTYQEYDGDTGQLFSEHGKIAHAYFSPASEVDLYRLLQAARADRQKYTPAVFKAHRAPRPSIQNQLKAERPQQKARPPRAARPDKEI